MSSEDLTLISSLKKSVVNVGLGVIVTMIGTFSGFYYKTTVQMGYLIKEVEKKADKELINTKILNLQNLINLQHGN